MWLFKKRKKKDDSRDNPTVTDKVAGKIAGAGIVLQNKFANGMAIIFQNMNTKRLKTFLVFFCLSAGGYSVYLVVNAIASPAKTEHIFKPQPVEMPKHFDKSGDELIPEASVDEETFHKVQGFKKYMDSLKQQKSYLYDSIINARPFLMDTVLMLEEIYYSQKQK